LDDDVFLEVLNVMIRSTSGGRDTGIFRLLNNRIKPILVHYSIGGVGHSRTFSHGRHDFVSSNFGCNICGFMFFRLDLESLDRDYQAYGASRLVTATFV
jgi:hypothetical protein